MLTVGIIGNGFVGKATRILECDAVQMVVFDILPELCVPEGLCLADLARCDIIFVAVPTPMCPDGSCHTGIVKSVLEDLAEVVDRAKTHIVMRSTVPPGFCDTYGIHFMPEFLTEKNWREDFKNQAHWYFGHIAGVGSASRVAFEVKMRRLIEASHAAGKIVHSNVHFVGNGEAEMVKYTRNTFLATKIAFFNEIEALCVAKEIDFEMVRQMAVADPRISASHTMVPGHDGHRGFGGTCFPKDIASLCSVFDKEGVPCHVLKAAQERNNKVDRPEGDWHDKGRSVV